MNTQRDDGWADADLVEAARGGERDAFAELWSGTGGPR
jgi:hypothetical protein